jgi:plastocyanin
MQPALARMRAFAAASVIAIASICFIGAAPINAAGLWNINVGPFSPPYAQLNSFYPNDITVHAGDTVRFNWLGFHTVTFNPPPNLSLLDFAFFGTPTASNSLDTPTTFVNGAPAFTSSGPPAPFDLKIGSNLPAGTYKFWCQLHQFMHGVIRVTNGPLPKQDSDYQLIGAAQLKADTAKAASLDSRLIKTSPKSEGEAVAGAGNKVAELFNFYPSFPANITIKVGDELTFTSRDLHEPHTVTFGNEPNPSDPFGSVFPSGPGNPKAYDGTSDLNSGFLFDESQYDYWRLGNSILSAAVPRTEFSVTFTKPGLYPFYCALHGGPHAAGQINGMSGNILVLPAEHGD